jgi:hypothetical protein
MTASAIRDGWTHTDLMLAGMWGGVAGALPDLQTQADRYVPPHHGDAPHRPIFSARLRLAVRTALLPSTRLAL